MTKHDAIKAYFEPKVSELAGDMLNFNFSPESEHRLTDEMRSAGKRNLNLTLNMWTVFH